VTTDPIKERITPTYPASRRLRLLATLTQDRKDPGDVAPGLGNLIRILQLLRYGLSPQVKHVTPQLLRLKVQLRGLHRSYLADLHRRPAPIIP